MADTKISALPAVTTPATTDEIPVNQGGSTKKETIAQIKDAIGIKMRSLSTQFLATANSVTMTNVANLDVALVAGHYFFQFNLIWRSNDATNGIRVNVNYTGTSGAFVFWWRWVDVSATASTAVPDQDAIIAAGQVMGAMASRAKRTTAAGGTLLSADTVNADMMLIVEGVFVATGAGDLELWAGNEAAGVGDQISIEVGSSVIVYKTG